MLQKRKAKRKKPGQRGALLLLPQKMAANLKKAKLKKVKQKMAVNLKKAKLKKVRPRDALLLRLLKMTMELIRPQSIRCTRLPHSKKSISLIEIHRYCLSFLP
jgi:hypothetical protein